MNDRLLVEKLTKVRFPSVYKRNEKPASRNRKTEIASTKSGFLEHLAFIFAEPHHHV